MNIKISYGHAVMELTENNGEWRIKRNGANVEEDKLWEIVRVMSGRDNQSIMNKERVNFCE